MLIKKLFAHRNTKKMLAGISLVLLLFVFSGSIALAEETAVPNFIGECTDGLLGVLCGVSLAIQSLILGVLTGLKSLFGWILSSMTYFTVWAIGDLGIKITTHEAVRLGFGISLSIANVIFVVAIIMIAFATILRWHEYEAKKMLPKLIITALLVNFSLLAAGLMLDTSNIFTKFFIGEDSSVITLKIGAALDPQTFGAPKFYGDVGSINTFKAKYNGAIEERGALSIVGTVLFKWAGAPDGASYSKESIKNNLGYSHLTTAQFGAIVNNPDSTELSRILKKNANNLRTSWFQNFLGLQSPVGGKIDAATMWSQFIDLLPKVIFSILATFVAMLTMVAMFIMALIRNIWVVVLLIVMPIAWAMRVLPKFEQYWEKWWEKFLNWGVLYLPTVSFFLYLAAVTAENTKAKIGKSASGEIFGMPQGISHDTMNFLGVSDGGSTPLITSFVLMLIVIGIMIAGLKIAQAMGSGVAGVFAGLAGKSGRKLAVGLLKTGTAATGMVLSPLGSWRGVAARWKYGSTEAGKIGKKDIKDFTNAGLTQEAAQLTREYKKAATDNMFAEAKAGRKALRGNLYGKVTERLSTGASRLSFIPGFGAAANFLAKTSAAQRESINREKEKFSHLSAAGRQAAYKAAQFGSLAQQAAAATVAHENHEHLPDGLAEKFADAIASLNPGTDRKDIALLKAMAGHDPYNAKRITGESAEEVFARADGEMARSWDMSHWGDTNVKAALQKMNDSLKRAVASKNDFNKNLMLKHTVDRLGDISQHMTDAQKTNMAGMLSDFAQVRSGGASADVMNRIEGHLEKLSDTDNKDIRGKFAAEQRTALNFGKDIARVITAVKSKSEHGSHGNLRDYEIQNIIKRVAGGLAGSVKAAAPSTNKGHSGGDSHSSGGH